MTESADASVLRRERGETHPQDAVAGGEARQADAVDAGLVEDRRRVADACASS